MLLIGARCDRCGATITWTGHSTKKDLKAWLRMNGWTVGKAYPHHPNTTLKLEDTFCPWCKGKAWGQKERKKKNEPEKCDQTASDEAGRNGAAST